MKYERLTRLQDWKKQALKTSTNYPETSDKRRRIGSTEKWSWFHIQSCPSSTADLCAATRVVHTGTRGIPWGMAEQEYLGTIIRFLQAYLGCAYFAWTIANSMHLHICPVVVGQIFVLSSSCCYIVKFLARLLWHLYSIHLWFEGNHNANILWTYILSTHPVFQFSVQVFKRRSQWLSRNLGSTDPVQESSGECSKIKDSRITGFLSTNSLLLLRSVGRNLWWPKSAQNTT